MRGQPQRRMECDPFWGLVGVAGVMEHRAPQHALVAFPAVFPAVHLENAQPLGTQHIGQPVWVSAEAGRRCQHIRRGRHGRIHGPAGQRATQHRPCFAPTLRIPIRERRLLDLLHDLPCHGWVSSSAPVVVGQRGQEHVRGVGQGHAFPGTIEVAEQAAPAPGTPWGTRT
ncbi:Uncharacterised protein [Mycobacteroides abscessus subsp. abscessus]|nr:Uncharacterised protein [Mycobacteroides abscessus subsp. abscessus]